MKKHTILNLILIVCIISISAGCRKTEIKNINSKGSAIICFGDSITFGYGALANEAYPVILSEKIKKPVINAGLDGNTSLQGLSRIQKEVLDKDPYLVIIEFCGNDFLTKVPKEETIKNISKMIDAVQAHGAIAAVLDVSANLFFWEYRWSLADLARRKGALFIPQGLRSIITNPSMKSDFFHPNASGYEKIAERVFNAIKPYITQ